MKGTRVGIIGGGWSGILTAKHCLEKGLEPIVFEKSDMPGGQWRYQPDQGGGVRHNTKTVSSKLYMSLPEFPLPESAPEFINASDIYDYFVKYIDNFRLSQFIKPNQDVASITKKGDKWEITTNQGSYSVDKLVIATGTNKVPNIPNDPMYEHFSGNKYHSHDLPELGDKFNGRSVLVIGGSDTASDVACELSDKANVTVSIRHGTWFQDRVVDELDPDNAGMPADMFYSRMVDTIFRMVGYDFVKTVGFVKGIEAVWGKSGSGIPSWQSEAGYLNTYYTKSRNLALKTREGAIKPRRAIEHIEGNKVYFENTSEPQYFDDIIFCTGYKPTLDFDFPYDPTTAELYRKVLSVDDPSVAFVGYIRPYLTSIVMLADLQARWLSNLFADEMPLPTLDKMKEVIASDEQYRDYRFPLYVKRMPFLVDPYHYMNGLADDLGVRPRFFWDFFHNPILYVRIMTDSWSHIAYRAYDPDPDIRQIAREQLEELHHHPISRRIRSLASVGLYHYGRNLSNWLKDLIWEKQSEDTQQASDALSAEGIDFHLGEIRPDIMTNYSQMPDPANKELDQIVSRPSMIVDRGESMLRRVGA